MPRRQRPTLAATPYAGGTKAILIVFSVLAVIEAGLLWLIDFGVFLDVSLLVLGIYSAVPIFGVHACSVTRPHVISSSGIRVRYAAFYDVWIPLENVSTLRWRTHNHDPTTATTFQDQTMVLPNMSHATNLVVGLHDPLTVIRPLGRTEQVRVPKFHADDPKAAVVAYEQVIPAQP